MCVTSHCGCEQSAVTRVRASLLFIIKNGAQNNTEVINSVSMSSLFAVKPNVVVGEVARCACAGISAHTCFPLLRVRLAHPCQELRLHRR